MSYPPQAVDPGRLAAGIDRALAFLRRAQASHGEFYSYMALSGTAEAEGVLDHSLFTTSHVLYCLSFLRTPATRAMTARALDYLAAEAEPPGVWRFWSSQHPRFIPPDTDDTCCASYALRLYRRAPNNGRLLLAHRDHRGCFYTWLIPPPGAAVRFPRFWLRSLQERKERHVFFRDTEAAPDDIDCVVNANALLYLQEREETRGAIEYLCQVMRGGSEEECDKWYRSKLAVQYMVSRAYHGGVEPLGEAAEPIVRNCEQCLTGNAPLSALDAALAACSLMNFRQHGRPLARAVGQLLDSQAATGEWTRGPFYFGGPKMVYNWGSRELTTAVALEALARFHALARPADHALTIKRPRDEDGVH
jgi:hypothetical protein